MTKFDVTCRKIQNKCEQKQGASKELTNPSEALHWQLLETPQHDFPQKWKTMPTVSTVIVWAEEDRTKCMVF